MEKAKARTRLSPLEPALEAPLKELGVAVAPLIPANEPDVSRDPQGRVGLVLRAAAAQALPDSVLAPIRTALGLDAPGASLLLKVNWDCFTVQVLQSPSVETHGRCSPCYPGQADLDAVGGLLCFALPPDLRAQA